MKQKAPKHKPEKETLFGIPLPNIRQIIVAGLGAMIVFSLLGTALNVGGAMRDRVQETLQTTLNVPVAIGAVHVRREQGEIEAAAVAVGNPRGVTPAVGFLIGAVEADITDITAEQIEIDRLELRDVMVDVHIQDDAISLVSFQSGINRFSSLDESLVKSEDDESVAPPVLVRVRGVSVVGGRLQMTLNGHALEPVDLPQAQFNGPGADGFAVTISEAIAGVTEGLIRHVIVTADKAGALDSLEASYLKEIRRRYGLLVEESDRLLPSGRMAPAPVVQEEPALLLRYDMLPAESAVP